MQLRPRNGLALLALAFASAGAETPEADPSFPEIEPNSEMKAQTRWVVGTLKSRHYLRDTIERLNGKEMVKAYLESFDNSKMFFLREDVEDFVFRYADSMEQFLAKGNLYPAFEIFREYRRTMAKRVEWIDKRLEDDFDFEADATFDPDRREAPWPESEEARDALWERRLKYELLNEMLSLAASPEKRARPQEAIPKDAGGSAPPETESESSAEDAPGAARESEAPTPEARSGGEPEAQNPAQAKTKAPAPASGETGGGGEASDGAEAPDGEPASDAKDGGESSEDGDGEESLEAQAERLRRLVEDQAYFEKILGRARKDVRRRYERNLGFTRERDPSEVQEAFLNAMTRLFDPHSSFFSAATLEKFNTSVQNSFVGIGALLMDDEGYCTIKELIPGGPAERSGKLDPEDQILAVAQGKDGEFVDVIDMELSHIVERIKGEKNTVVRLLIRPAEATDPSVRQEVSLVRDEVKLTANLASARVVDVPAADGKETIAVGVIELPSFYGNIGAGEALSNTSDDVEELIGKLKDAGANGLVLDLRRNGGGLLSEAVKLAGLFIPKGPVVQVREGKNKVDILRDRDPSMIWDKPLVVLTSKFSASASEIVAGALRDHNRAVVVGDESTHGKGTVQEVFQMRSQSGFSLFGNNTSRKDPVATKITIKQFYLPDGASTQLKGVPSNIVLPSANQFLPIGESDLDHALPWDKIDSLDWQHDWDGSGVAAADEPNLMEALQARSERRQKALEEFRVLRRQIDWRRERHEREQVSLNLAERVDKKIADRKFLEGIEDDFEALKENDFRSETITLEVREEQQAKSREIQGKEDASAGEPGDAEGRDDAGGDGLDDGDGSLLGGPEPEIDIHLREAARIVADWIRAERGALDAADIARQAETSETGENAAEEPL